ncbi:MAG: hypothetical protein FJX91_02050 [Bacteroidetes bacterium]|nr:hypothetical protein [Bacteroidota bacterium]
MQEKYAYIIQGAGASGLWLAYWMDQQGLLESKQLLIIEGDSNKLNDRTWCFWTDESTQDFPFVDRQWSSLWVQGQTQPIAPYQYCHARSAIFYQWIKSSLHKNAHVHWCTDWVTGAEQINSGVQVKTEKATYLADYFFYSGGVAAATKNASIELWQSFVGWRVKILEGQWEPAAATLMDFGIAQMGTTRFVYVLPISETEGLIEITQFYKYPLSQAHGEDLLRQLCVDRRWRVEVLEVEVDAIPMSSIFNQTQPHFPNTERILPIGVAAGALKPTTGYGFLAMRDHGKAMATALQQGEALPRIYRKKRFRFYDALLLQLLMDNPERGKAIFERLFSRQPAQHVLKFLNERTSLWEEVQIFSKLQVSWFLKALIKYVGS